MPVDGETQEATHVPFCCPCPADYLWLVIFVPIASPHYARGKRFYDWMATILRPGIYTV